MRLTLTTALRVSMVAGIWRGFGRRAIEGGRENGPARHRYASLWRSVRRLGVGRHVGDRRPPLPGSARSWAHCTGAPPSRARGRTRRCEPALGTGEHPSAISQPQIPITSPALPAAVPCTRGAFHGILAIPSLGREEWTCVIRGSCPWPTRTALVTLPTSIAPPLPLEFLLGRLGACRLCQCSVAAGYVVMTPQATAPRRARAATCPCHHTTCFSPSCILCGIPVSPASA